MTLLPGGLSGLGEGQPQSSGHPYGPILAMVSLTRKAKNTLHIAVRWAVCKELGPYRC